ncbi:MAG: 23S rRNA (pseudouridine(1915)-N(3))-methyltransferase RlmH [Ferrovum myxofaciens]|nr:23S rRNA (pseudouridine(1915)-N(3))-methyltransferase RlmH [Ferrovum myxofaciens]QKE38207.2 MAG: 23S rRNA (pseudouridine(1915)-N(3))-methyltransferase RlmH [Ferrovum myxofaciens]
MERPPQASIAHRPGPRSLKLRLLTLGQRMPAWVTEASRTYAARMPREFSLDVVELRAAPRQDGRTREQLLTREADDLLTTLGSTPFHALDERGSLWTTLELAKKLEQAQQTGDSLAFVIGSADGLHPRIFQHSRAPLALSRMTLPHGLARVLMVEQLYRAVMILKGHPYHRDS